MYGLGRNLLFKIFRSLGYNKTFKTINSGYIFNENCNFIDFFTRFIYLESEYYLNSCLKIKKLISLFCSSRLCMYNYKGMRKIKGLPCRGQRTKTNHKTTKSLRVSRYRHLSVSKYRRADYFYKKILNDGLFLKPSSNGECDVIFKD